MLNQIQLYVLIRHLKTVDRELAMKIRLIDGGDDRYLMLYPVDLKSFHEALCLAWDMDTLKIHRRTISNLTKNFMSYRKQYRVMVGLPEEISDDEK